MGIGLIFRFTYKKRGLVDYQKAVERVMAHPQYKKNIAFGEPRSGHPEGKVQFHIAELESNLERLKPYLPQPDQYWKLKFLIHIHDSFKINAAKGVPSTDPRHHAVLAKTFASQFITDQDMLAMIQYHDESYYLWRQVCKNGRYNRLQFTTLLETIQDWDLFLIFNIIDGHTAGKNMGKLPWFIHEVRKYKEAAVDVTWIGFLQ